MVGELALFKYRAFLSFAPADKAWAEWLQRALEGTRIPWDLVGRETSAGPVPRSLRPIFRPEEPLAEALNEPTLAALSSSQFLIVLCSPEAAKSEAANETVRRFKMMGRASRIIPVIVAGAPGDAERECLSPALRFKLGTDGAPTEEREEPVAPIVIDARPEGDGKERARLKLVAALLGLEADEMMRRARKRRARMRTAVAAAILALLALGGGGLAAGWYMLQQDASLLDATLQRATRLVDDVAETSDALGAPRVSLAIVETAEGVLRRMAALGAETPQHRYRKAWMLMELGGRYDARGKGEAQRARAVEAQRLLDGISAPGGLAPAFQRDLSLAFDRIGHALFAQGATEEAAKSYRTGLAITERLATMQPDDAGLQRDLSVAHNELGDVLFAQGAAEDALTNYRAALAIRERRAAAEPRNAGAQRDLSVSQERIGDVLLAQGALEEAVKRYRASLALRLAGIGTDNGSRPRDLTVSYNKVGDALMAQHAPAEALGLYRTGLALHLAAPDQANAGWQRDLSVSHERIGDALMAQRAFDEALQSYRASLDIRARLTAEPGNASWRRDLPVTHERIGDALQAKGALDDALKSYRASLALRERLAAADPQSAVAQRDLAVSYNKIGDALVALREIADARASYRAGLAIRERLAARDPGNAQAQWDVVVLQWRLATHGDDPAERFARIVETLRKLKAETRLSAEQARWLPAAEKELAQAERR